MDQNNQKPQDKNFETLIGEQTELALVAAAPSAGRIVAAALTALAVAANSEHCVDGIRTARIAYGKFWRVLRAWAEAFKTSGGLVAVLEFHTALRAVKAAIRAVPKATRSQVLAEYASRFPNDALKREAGKWEQEVAKADAFFSNPFALPKSPPTDDIPEADSIDLEDLEPKDVN